MSRRELPPLLKLAARIHAAVEDAAAHFPRRHRYGLGVRLASRAYDARYAAQLAWREPQRQLLRVRELSLAIDHLKIDLQLSKDLNVFRSFGEFEAVARLVTDLGRQCGGWLKSLQPTGQNGGAVSPGQRASILSSRAASQGATP